MAVLILDAVQLFTNLLINGVQKLVSAVISPTKRKYEELFFVWLFLLLDAGQFTARSITSTRPDMVVKKIKINASSD
ncbi:hypothetical protein B1P88_11225 [Enterococcus faecium]|nr:hypothetical protein B1P88_11225 [Enterococcus faecium]